VGLECHKSSGFLFSLLRWWRRRRRRRKGREAERSFADLKFFYGNEAERIAISKVVGNPNTCTPVAQGALKWTVRNTQRGRGS
jgi:hypothetical protein